MVYITNIVTIRIYWDILKTIKKINVVAYPIEEGNVSTYEVKMQVLKTILDQDRYKTLMKYGSNKEGATLKYVGLEDAIDEMIRSAVSPHLKIIVDFLNQNGYSLMKMLMLWETGLKEVL